MLTRLILLTNSIFAVVKADFVLKPRDTDVLIGDSIYFECATKLNINDVHWNYYAVGAKDHEDVCLYCMGRVHPRYRSRIEVERNISAGNCYTRLLINSVQREDAGRYICHNNGGIGESVAAQLVILESKPNCTSNMKPDGVLGPNSCGFNPDTLHLSCHVSYHGNIPPIITWRRSGTPYPINSSFCHNVNNRVTCTLTMTVDFDLNGASYICETHRSTAVQYTCVSDAILLILYTNPNNSVQKIMDGTEDGVCSVNSSQPCNHTWTRLDAIEAQVVAHGSALVTRKPGWYQCESVCTIRGKRCTVSPKLCYVSEPNGLSMTAAVAIGCIVTLAVVLIIIGSVRFICLRKGKRAKPFNYRNEDPFPADTLNRNEKTVECKLQTSVNLMEKKSILKQQSPREEKLNLEHIYQQTT